MLLVWQSQFAFRRTSIFFKIKARPLKKETGQSLTLLTLTNSLKKP